MKISCVITVSNRLLPSLSLSNRKPELSTLSIGYGDKDKNQLFVLFQTRSNGFGVKYKVNDNVVHVFSKFLSEGKLTIRFKAPPHDLIIKGKAHDVRQFASTLNLGLEGKLKTHLPCLVSQKPSKIAAKPKTKLSVNSKQDIPILEGYPRSLETLQLNHVELHKIDGRIFRLQHLQVLDLEDNALESIPSQIDLLPNLKCLNLAKNKLGASPNWSWLKSESLRRSLVTLNLGENNLIYLPKEIVRLKSLTELMVHKNQLRRLPDSNGHLKSLRHLSVSENHLEWLPGSVQLLRLASIDISHNSFQSDALGDFLGPYNQSDNDSCLPTLVDLAARQVIIQRLDLGPADLPVTLLEYLENCAFCECGSPTFPSAPERLIRFKLQRIATMVTCSSNNPTCLMAVRYCSPKCKSKRDS